jgi:hypothetical protein
MGELLPACCSYMLTATPAGGRREEVDLAILPVTCPGDRHSRSLPPLCRAVARTSSSCGSAASSSLPSGAAAAYRQTFDRLLECLREPRLELTDSLEAGSGRWSRSVKGCGVISGRFAAAARGLKVRHDHGSQYMSDHFQKEIAFLGIESSPAFVRAPEGNGCAERFIRTLKENLLWVRTLNVRRPPTGAAGAPRDLQHQLADRTARLHDAEAFRQTQLQPSLLADARTDQRDLLRAARRRAVADAARAFPAAPDDLSLVSALSRRRHLEKPKPSPCYARSRACQMRGQSHRCRHRHAERQDHRGRWSMRATATQRGMLPMP